MRKDPAVATAIMDKIRARIAAAEEHEAAAIDSLLDDHQQHGDCDTLQALADGSRP